MPRPRKINREPHTLQARTSKAAYQVITDKAIEFGYVYGGKAALGEFFETFAEALKKGDLNTLKKKADNPLDG